MVRVPKKEIPFRNVDTVIKLVGYGTMNISPKPYMCRYQTKFNILLTEFFLFIKSHESTFHLYIVHVHCTADKKLTNVYVIRSKLILCFSLSATDLSLCAVMEFNGTFMKRHFLNAEWKVMVLLF